MINKKFNGLWENSAVMCTVYNGITLSIKNNFKILKFNVLSSKIQLEILLKKIVNKTFRFVYVDIAN